MPKAFAPADIILSFLAVIGLIQLAWFSVILWRRGIPGEHIRQALPPLLAIWVLMWPVYADSRWLWAGWIAFFVLTLLAHTLRKPFWRHLRAAWTPTDEPGYERAGKLPPLSPYSIGLAIAGLWFQAIPEFGFGLGLCLCLAMPAAFWVDRWMADYPRFRLGFPAHPEQTLPGHLVFILTAAALLCWALQVYHDLPWRLLFIATLIAAIAGSATRALTPGEWHPPAAMLTMGITMWLL